MTTFAAIRARAAEPVPVDTLEAAMMTDLLRGDVATLLAAVDRLVERDRLATIVMEDLDGLATGSEGVVGWHMNGEVLPWDQVECLTALGEWMALEHGARTKVGADAPAGAGVEGGSVDG